eukprot:Filipodium_phascolosomae@DN2013_c0_g1_i1.p1
MSDATPTHTSLTMPSWGGASEKWRPSRRSIQDPPNLTLLTGPQDVRVIPQQPLRAAKSKAHELDLTSNPLFGEKESTPFKPKKKASFLSDRMRGDDELFQGGKRENAHIRESHKKVNAISERGRGSVVFRPEDARTPKVRIGPEGYEMHYKGIHSDGLFRDLPDFKQNPGPCPEGIPIQKPVHDMQHMFGEKNHTSFMHSTPLSGHMSSKRKSLIGVSQHREVMDSLLTPCDAYDPHTSPHDALGSTRKLSHADLAKPMNKRVSTLTAASLAALSPLAKYDEATPHMLARPKAQWVGTHGHQYKNYETGYMHRPTVSLRTPKPLDHKDMLSDIYSR